MKHFDEPFDIRLIVVNVRTDAKSAHAPGHVNFFGRERLNEPARYASRKTYAQNMRCPKTHLRKRHSRFLQAFGEPRVNAASRALIAVPPHCAIISMPIAAISIDMK